MMSRDTAATIESLNRLQTVTYLHVAGITLLVADWIMTLHDELVYVWPAPWNVGKVLFFLTRYPVFVDAGLGLYHQIAFHLSAEDCVMLFKISGWMVIGGIGVAEAILLLRVWALWDRTRRMAIVLIFVFIAAFIAAAVGFIKFHVSQKFTPMDSISPDIPGCFTDSGNNDIFVAFLVLMGLESLILAMTWYRGMQRYRRGSSSFVNSFFKDGLMYFGALYAVSVANVVVLFINIHEYANLLTSLQRNLHAMLSARILLHLREEAYKMSVDHTNEMTLGQPIGELIFVRTTHVRRTRGGQTSWFGEETSS